MPLPSCDSILHTLSELASYRGSCVTSGSLMRPGNTVQANGTIDSLCASQGRGLACGHTLADQILLCGVWSGKRRGRALEAVATSVRACGRGLPRGLTGLLHRVAVWLTQRQRWCWQRGHPRRMALLPHSHSPVGTWDTLCTSCACNARTIDGQ